MAKLNQILAIEKGLKNTAYKALTELHRTSEQPNLYEGRVRVYRPLADDGETLPDETQLVQQTATEVLKRMVEIVSPLWDTTATKDFGNCTALADVTVDGQLLLTKVPVTYLLFLEKQLNDLETFITKLPTLDPSQSWQKDNTLPGQYQTAQTEQNRNKKTPRNHVKAEATREHPAQVEVYYEDVVIGRYNSMRRSGALAVDQKQKLQSRVRKLKDAVLFAREQANGVDTKPQHVAEPLLGYLVNDL